MPSVPHVLWPHAFSQECDSCHFVNVISLAIVHVCAWRMIVEIVTHVQSTHHSSSPPSPPGFKGRLPALIDRISTSAPAELLEAPPVFADSCGGSTSSRRARFVESVLPSLGAAASSSGLANSFRLIKLYSRHFACAKIILHT